MRSQLFSDGNKRTAIMIANHHLIQHGTGLLTIQIEYQDTFRTLLIDYYETNDDTKIFNLIYEYCLDGIIFDRK